jgi:predicted DNA repair protein MutK
MPKLLSLLSAVGVMAMLWVGGHILRAGSDQLGWHTLEGLIGHAVESVGAVLTWLVNTAVSAVIGLAVGVVVFALMHLLSLVTRSAS